VTKLAFISIHPEFIQSYLNIGIFNRASTAKLASFETIGLRDYAIDNHGTIDSRPYGGGDGMVLRPEPLARALDAYSDGRKVHTIYTSPAGKQFEHHDAVRLSEMPKDIVFICGRFAGVDQRFIDRRVDEQFSLGSFVVSGGELPCLLIADALLRQVRGVLGNDLSAENDSFAAGLNGMVEFPLYSRPEEFEGVRVPEELLSGNHERIQEWRNQHLTKK